MERSGTLFSSLLSVDSVNIYVCAEGKLFFDFEHGVLIGFATEGHGLCFPFAIFMPLLVCTIAPS